MYDESAEFLEQLHTPLGAMSFSIHFSGGSVRKEKLIFRCDSSVSFHWVAKSSRQAPSITAASPLTFLSRGFAVILSTIFTLSVSGSWSENSARPTASSERCHEWLSRDFLAATLISDQSKVINLVL